MGAHRQRPVSSVVFPGATFRLWIGDSSGCVSDCEVFFSTHPLAVKSTTVDPVTIKLIKRFQLPQTPLAMCCTWDQTLMTLLGSTRRRVSLAKTVCIGSSEGLIRVNLRSYEVVGTHSSSNGQPITALAFLPSANELWSAGGDSQLSIWDPLTGKLLSVLPTDLVGLVLCPLHVGDRIITASNNGTMVLWDVRTRTPLQRIQNSFHAAKISAVVASLQSEVVWSCSEDGRICSWNLQCISNHPKLDVDDPF